MSSCQGHVIMSSCHHVILQHICNEWTELRRNSMKRPPVLPAGGAGLSLTANCWPAHGGAAFTRRHRHSRHNSLLTMATARAGVWWAFWLLWTKNLSLLTTSKRFFATHILLSPLMPMMVLVVHVHVDDCPRKIRLMYTGLPSNNFNYKGCPWGWYAPKLIIYQQESESGFG